MKNYNELSSFIIENVGGKDNISSVSHCVTRLRFYLIDESLAQESKLASNKEILTIVRSGGQFQVVIGNHVPLVYEAISESLNLDQIKQESNASHKKSPIEVGFSLLGVVIGPPLNLIFASGIILGLNILGLHFNLYSITSRTFIVLDAISKTLLYFFPIIVAEGIAESLKGDRVLAMILGGVLCYPTMAFININAFNHQFVTSYAGSFLPVMFIVPLGLSLDKRLKEILPNRIKDFIAPTIVLLTVAPIGIFLIGPLANLITISLSDGLSFIANLNPIIIGTLVGAIWQLLVVLGIHGLITLIPILLLLQGGSSAILGISGIVAFSQIAVVFAIYVKTKNEDLKSRSKAGIISGIFGITEPAIYGVTEPRTKMFAISCVGGAIAGFLVGYYNLTMQTLSGLGVFSLFGFLKPYNPNIMGIIVAVVVPALVSFTLAYFMFSDENDIVKNTTNADKLDENMNLIDQFSTEEKKKPQNISETLVSPITGCIIKTSEISDPVFSSQALGNTIGLIPTIGEIYAPFDGTVAALYPSKHAIGLISTSGIEVLIHIGIDTVNLSGEHFSTLVEQGEKIKQGQLLITFDLDEIISKGYKIDTPMIVSNSDEYLDFILTSNKNIEAKEDLLTIIY